LLSLLLSSAVPAQDFDQLSLVQITSGLNLPLAVVNAGDGSNRLFIVERHGKIKILPAGAHSTIAVPFLDIGLRVDSAGREQGLLGLVFHPDYKNNGFFYVHYIRDPGAGSDISVIARYSVSGGNADIANGNSELKLMEIAQEAANHNGGDLHFGPDGFLYIGLGDGGGSKDFYDNAQNIDTLKGAILRIDVDSAPSGDKQACGAGLNYDIPDDNPFIDTGGCDEIWSFGLRNPWRFSFDRDTGDMLIGDVGQLDWEEIDFEPPATPGINYGWSCREGAHDYVDGHACISAYQDPVLEYSHNPACSVTGGYVYRGGNTAFNGYYFYGDYCSSQIWLARDGDTGWTSAEWLFTPGTLGSISSFGEDEDGNLYIADLQEGKVFRIQMPGDEVFSDSFEDQP
jgi:glucose/arabinose dehydrogenase